MTPKQLEAKAKRLARKFYDDAQALFDHYDMTVEVAEGPVFEALNLAQSYAEEVWETDA